MKKNSIVIGSVLAVIAAFAIGVFAFQNKKVEERKEAAAAGGSSLIKFHSPTTGPADAKVTIVEFFDPSCEACRAYYPYVKSILAENPTKVRLVLRYAAFHRGSDEVVKMLEAAKLQGFYWQSLEAVLQNQPQWADHGNPNVQLVWDYLKPVGVDIDKAKKDMTSSRIASILEQDMADVATLKVDKTPTFFVNGKPLLQMNPDGLRALVQQEIQTYYP
jgi:protein-disulfide isomerase